MGENQTAPSLLYGKKPLARQTIDHQLLNAHKPQAPKTTTRLFYQIVVAFAIRQTGNRQAHFRSGYLESQTQLRPPHLLGQSVVMTLGSIFHLLASDVPLLFWQNKKETRVETPVCLSSQTRGLLCCTEVQNGQLFTVKWSTVNSGMWRRVGPL